MAAAYWLCAEPVLTDFSLFSSYYHVLAGVQRGGHPPHQTKLKFNEFKYCPEFHLSFLKEIYEYVPCEYLLVLGMSNHCYRCTSSHSLINRTLAFNHVRIKQICENNV